MTSPLPPTTCVRSLITRGTICPNRAQVPALLVCIRVELVGGPVGARGSQASSHCIDGPNGEFRILDMSAPSHDDGDAAAEWVQFLLPHAEVTGLAEEFRRPVGASVAGSVQLVDPVLRRLAQLALSRLEGDAPHNDAALEHLYFTLCAHVMQTRALSQMQAHAQTSAVTQAASAVTQAASPLRPTHAARPNIGGLAPWQRRLAMELMQEHLSQGIDLARLAGACRLSVSHFARCFKQSLGVSAHRYLMQLRVETAKERLVTAHSPLAEIALECGFSDQAAFSRTFGAMVGSSPGRWRRQSGAEFRQDPLGHGAATLTPVLRSCVG